jgi:predicted permease
MTNADEPRPASTFLRISLWLVGRASALVPFDRRDEWRRAWTGELWHRARKLESEGGLTPAQGLDLVRRSLGAFSHALFLATTEPRLGGFGKDLIHGMRSLRSKPGFTTVALLTLGLGIGANTFLYSLAESVLLHPFPYRDIDRLVAFESSFPKLSSEKEFIESMAIQDFLAIEEESRTLTSFIAFDLGNRDLGGVAEPQRLLTAAFWGDAFETLGMAPALGRGFTREEMERGEPVAILSHRVFQQHFGGDPALVGRPILVNGAPRTLVGVMPPRLLLLDADLWLPMWYRRDEPIPRSRRVLTVLARLNDGASLEDAKSEVAVLARGIEREGMKEAPEYEGFRISLSPFLQIWSNLVGPAAWILMAAAALALAIACGNIAGLLLARGLGRRQEMAIRTALGARRGRLIGHLLSESILLAGGGGALALLVAQVTLEATMKRLPSQLPLMGIEVDLDSRALAFTFAVSSISALVFGLVPAIQSARGGAPANLAPGGRSFGSATAVRARRFFVSMQIAASLVLVSGAALTIKSFDRLLAVDPGVDVENVLTLRVTLPWERYEGKLVSFYDRWLEEVENIPGVRASGLTTQFPPMVFVRSRLAIEHRPLAAEEDLFATYDTVASPGVFDALGMKLVRGRFFDDGDTGETPTVVVVNGAFASRYFPDEDPLGRRIRAADDPSQAPWATIVGIVSDARNRGLEQETSPELWTSHRQQGDWNNQMHLVLRTEGDPREIVPSVRERLRRLDPDLPVYAVQTLVERYDTVVFTRRFASIALAALATMSLLLAAMGLYGVIAFLVGERRRELGLRLALGAEGKTLVGHLLGEALKLVGVGVALGLAGALALTRFLSGMLFQVAPHDPASLAGTVAVIVVVALVAALVPARRASRVDPVESLR